MIYSYLYEVVLWSLSHPSERTLPCAPCTRIPLIGESQKWFVWKWFVPKTFLAELKIRKIISKILLVTRQRNPGTSDQREASSRNAQVSLMPNVIGEASTVVVLWLQLGHQQCASHWFVAAGSQNQFVSRGRMPFPKRGQAVSLYSTPFLV